MGKKKPGKAGPDASSEPPPPPCVAAKALLAFSDHQSNGKEAQHGPIDGHVESPDRVAAILARLRSRRDLWRTTKKVARRCAGDRELRLCHDDAHIIGLQKLANLAAADAKTRFVPKSGPVCMAGPCCDVREGGSGEDDTFVTAGSFEAARLSVGGLLEIVDEVLEGDGPSCGFALCRPPGHHAARNRSSGFCLVNNVAVAAAYAKDRYPQLVRKVLILDWDVHHGQGTQAIFDGSSEVLVINIHRYDGKQFYPATGGVGEVGFGSGKGYTINVPLPEGYGGLALWNACNSVVLPAARNFKPDLLLVSAGFDAAEGDPLGGCVVPPRLFGRLTLELRRLAVELGHGRVILALEGGYDTEVLANCGEEVMQALVAEVENGHTVEPFAEAAPDWLEGSACNGPVRKACEVHHSLALRLPLPASKSERRKLSSQPDTSAATTSVKPVEDAAAVREPSDSVRPAEPADVPSDDVKASAEVESCSGELELHIRLQQVPQAPKHAAVSREELWLWFADIRGGKQLCLRKYRFDGVLADDTAELQCAEFRKRKQELSVRLKVCSPASGPVRIRSLRA
eukprot:TRINITY_DN30218_c0_g1_i1.p1 TRINITY_DN30218_c0_g1~~TRINITY_DN30218_c0_g1_i1.p1  ORF type:complete len:570 (+),score=132.61 TRINITY_DN30218_c0_g1_i1:74-1783(+)